MKLLFDVTASKDREKAIRKLRAMESMLPTPATRFAVPFVFRAWGHCKRIKPTQTPEEILGLYERVCALKPRRVLEIGTARGGTFYLWCQAATDDAVLVSMDLPGGQFGGGYVEHRTGLYEAFGRPEQTIHLIRGNSHDDANRQRIGDLFGSDPVDFLFIDGDHTYEGVRDDFLHYRHLVRPGGIIGFHDIMPSPDPDTNVDRFWRQVKEQGAAHYRAEELVHTDKHGRQLGIGVLHAGEGHAGLVFDFE